MKPAAQFKSWPRVCDQLNKGFVSTQIFTTLVLTQDRLIVAANAVQGSFNSVLLWQTALTAAGSAGRAGKQLSDVTTEDEEEVLCLPACVQAALRVSTEAWALAAAVHPTASIPSVGNASLHLCMVLSCRAALCACSCNVSAAAPLSPSPACLMQPVGVSPAAIEAAESDAEDGTVGAGDGGAAAAAAMGGDGGAGIGGGDGGGGGYGGLGSALFEPSPMDFPMDSNDRGYD